MKVFVIRLVTTLAIVLLFLGQLPPFFTDGACSSEFDSVTAQVGESSKAFQSPTSAKAYWASRHIPVRTISPEQCRISKPRFVAACGPGDLLYVAVPVQNRVCRFYRDSAITVQIQYDDRERLRRLRTDMDPFKFFPIPWLGITLNWAK
jgi:hypothetical protein